MFPALLMTVILLFALMLGSLPNGVQLEATMDLAFLQILWQSNPWETVKLVLVDKPLMVVEHHNNGTGLQIWGLFYFANTVLVYLLASLFTALQRQRLINSTARQRLLFAAGTVAVLVSVTYLRRAGCCTGGPGWVLDTWLVAKVYIPDLGSVNWMSIYQRAHPWLPLLQKAMLVGGIAMLYQWYLGAKQDS